jgi:hypothetical protein
MPVARVQCLKIGRTGAPAQHEGVSGPPYFRSNQAEEIVCFEYGALLRGGIRIKELGKGSVAGGEAQDLLWVEWEFVDQELASPTPDQSKAHTSSRPRHAVCFASFSWKR